MRVSILPLFRRARRLAFNVPIVQLYRYLVNSNSPFRAHFKIDDEQPLDYDHPAARHPRRRRRSTFQRIGTMIALILCVILIVVFILAWTAYKPPDFLIDFLQWKYPDVLFRVPLSQKMVALTLDDAPSTSTAQVLDVLKTYNATATFFVIGSQVEPPGRPELLQRMHDEGHEIGNHAWNDYPSFKLPLPTLEQQMKDVDALLPPNIPPNGGPPLKYFRPGSGIFNKAMLEVAKSLGYRVVLGSIYPHDPQIPSPKINSMHVLSMVQPGGIIIMHDRRYYSAEQLELVLKGLTADGWKVGSVGALLRAAEEESKHK